jgi:hypothetical protein
MPPLARLNVVVVRDRWLRSAPPPVMNEVTASAVKKKFIIVTLIFREWLF